LRAQIVKTFYRASWRREGATLSGYFTLEDLMHDTLRNLLELEKNGLIAKGCEPAVADG
jgi:hypothetical protein